LSLLFPINSTAVVDMDILTSAVARLDAVEFDMLWNRVIPTVAEITQDLLRVASTNREPSVLDYLLKESLNSILMTRVSRQLWETAIGRLCKF
jgi:hypothetical protein